MGGVSRSEHKVLDDGRTGSAPSLGRWKLMRLDMARFALRHREGCGGVGFAGRLFQLSHPLVPSL